jgi:hypothetical protein
MSANHPDVQEGIDWIEQRARSLAKAEKGEG